MDNLLTTSSENQPQVSVTMQGFVKVRIGSVEILTMSHILAERLAMSLLDAVKKVDELRKG